jgi:hypothetical protein
MKLLSIKIRAHIIVLLSKMCIYTYVIKNISRVNYPADHKCISISVAESVLGQESVKKLLKVRFCKVAYS